MLLSLKYPRELCRSWAVGRKLGEVFDRDESLLVLSARLGDGGRDGEHSLLRETGLDTLRINTSRQSEALAEALSAAAPAV